MHDLYQPILITRATAIVVASFAFALLMSVRPAEAAAKRIFYVGNSFTLDYDVPGLVARVASSAGRAWPSYQSSLERSTDFDYHIGRLSGADSWKLTSMRYDAVVLQGFSSEPTRAGDPWDYRRDAVTLARMVRNHSPSARVVMEQTWAYHPYNRELYPHRIPDAWAMNYDLKTNTQAARSDIQYQLGGSNVTAFVGDVIATRTGFRNDLYASYDWKHQSQRGAVLTALVLYQAIYSDNVSDISYNSASWWLGPRGISSSQWSQMRSWVDNYYYGWSYAQAAPVPEPAMLAAGAAGCVALRRRRHC